MGDEIKEYISKEKLSGIVKRVAREIVRDAEDGEILLLTVMNGALPFSRDLRREIEGLGRKVRDYSIKVKSYEGMKSGDLTFEGVEENFSGRDIYIVEDIVDSGRTMDFLINYLLKEKGAQSVKVVSLLSKPSKREVDVPIDYLGIEIEDKFVIGYGLDYDGKYRELDFIGVLGEG
ncbi:MAG: phosphoribosyltransferase family protein [archaeon]